MYNLTTVGLPTKSSANRVRYCKFANDRVHTQDNSLPQAQRFLGDLYVS